MKGHTMACWLDVANTEELASGMRRVVDADGVAVAVFNLDGDYFAVCDACPHDGGELSSGVLEGDVIVCPRHGARFSIKSGAVLGPPAYEDLRTYPVRIAGGMVQIEFEGS
ncbi:MAG: non-heme iron oxygenase ferredoxin subunit [Sideroxydans sp.]|jgi:3-phenylpropionate/trans-cinnamate dioxygenase ferredoxin subunit